MNGVSVFTRIGLFLDLKAGSLNRPQPAAKELPAGAFQRNRLHRRCDRERSARSSPPQFREHRVRRPGQTPPPNGRRVDSSSLHRVLPLPEQPTGGVVQVRRLVGCG